MSVIAFPASKIKTPTLLDLRSDDQLKDVSKRSISLLAKRLLPARMLAKHVFEQRRAAQDKFNLPIHTVWDAPRHVMRAWAGDVPWEAATFRAEWGTTEAGAIRRLRNKRAVPTLLSNEPAPDAASQESRPPPDVHLSDALESRRLERQKAPSIWGRVLVFVLVMLILALCGAVAFLAIDRMTPRPARAPVSTASTDQKAVIPVREAVREIPAVDSGPVRRRRQ